MVAAAARALLKLVDLLRRLGFRQGLVDLHTWPNWEAFERELPTLGDPYFFSTKATRLFWDAPLGASTSVVLVFGRETGGLPRELHERYRDRFVRMPILSPRVRSLNLSTSVAIAVYEVLRQRRG